MCVPGCLGSSKQQSCLDSHGSTTSVAQEGYTTRSAFQLTRTTTAANGGGTHIELVVVQKKSTLALRIHALLAHASYPKTADTAGQLQLSTASVAIKKTRYLTSLPTSLTYLLN